MKIYSGLGAGFFCQHPPKKRLERIARPVGKRPKKSYMFRFNYVNNFLKITCTLNPNYALDFVMKSKNTRKLSAHGLFKILEYINILTF